MEGAREMICRNCGEYFDSSEPTQIRCADCSEATAKYIPTRADIERECYSIRAAKNELATGDLR